jgi:hypothetical protein
MAEPKIRRRFRAVPVTLGTAVDASTALRWDEVAGGTLLLAAGTTETEASTTVQLWASGDADGTFARLYDSDGEPADLTIVRDSANATSYALPDACYGVGALKLVAGSTHLTAATVMLKT